MPANAPFRRLSESTIKLAPVTKLLPNHPRQSGFQGLYFAADRRFLERGPENQTIHDDAGLFFAEEIDFGAAIPSVPAFEALREFSARVREVDCA
jgi:hypothetical protein